MRYDQNNLPRGFRRATYKDSYKTIIKRNNAKRVEKIISKLKYNEKIDNYIPINWNFNKKISDKEIYITSLLKDNTKILQEALINHSGFVEFMQIAKEVQYIIREITNNNFIIVFFYGDSEKAFNKVMERKASFFSNIPSIINGRICGNVDLSEILNVSFNYCREYGLYLKKLYDEGKIDKYHLGKDISFKHRN